MESVRDIWQVGGNDTMLDESWAPVKIIKFIGKNKCSAKHGEKIEI